MLLPKIISSGLGSVQEIGHGGMGFVQDGIRAPAGDRRRLRGWRCIQQVVVGCARRLCRAICVPPGLSKKMAGRFERGELLADQAVEGHRTPVSGWSVGWLLRCTDYTYLACQLSRKAPDPARGLGLDNTVKGKPASYHGHLANLLDPLTAPARLVHGAQPDGALRCTACAHRCLVRPGRRGICQVRFHDGEALRVPVGLRRRPQRRPGREEALLPFPARGDRPDLWHARLRFPLRLLPELAFLAGPARPGLRMSRPLLARAHLPGADRAGGATQPERR